MSDDPVNVVVLPGSFADEMCRDAPEDQGVRRFVAAAREHAAAKHGKNLAVIPYPVGTQLTVMTVPPGLDPELQEIHLCVQALRRLDPDTAARVLDYLADRFGGGATGDG